MMVRRVVLSSVLLLAAFAACIDPVHEDAVAKLGEEQPGVPKGPLHRPGQPCGVCHGGSGPGEPQFSLAGTIYIYPDGTGREGAENATIKVTDAKKSTRTFRSNSAGNFYLKSGEWDFASPLKVEVTYRGETQKMTTHIGREGSCGYCHVSPPGPDSPGRIYGKKADALTPKPSSDAGTTTAKDAGSSDSGAGGQN